jgi:FKBP-type peptidyl-prolyl cis-trans isomerase FkpA
MFRYFCKNFIPIIVLAGLVFHSSCTNLINEEKQQQQQSAPPTESLFDANKAAVKTEDQHIRDYLNRYRWDVTETGTGLRYLIYKNGSGKKAVTGSKVTCQYTVSLLNGTTIYSSDESGPLEFTVGRGGVESGLEEGILLLREGDHAKFVLPSHLAHGLTGDQDKIPPKTTIIYDIVLTKVY